ncbi:hypothetical protein VNO77_21309 [Canavalia gladiata]|uniref:Uncharacterized protein n=1 Tax=Canavalia gladiata TaxID=3824 RepID=A0AAN9LR22_CANGL
MIVLKYNTIIYPFISTHSLSRIATLSLSALAVAACATATFSVFYASLYQIAPAQRSNYLTIFFLLWVFSYLCFSNCMQRWVFLGFGGYAESGLNKLGLGVKIMILTKQYRCVHSASCQCTKGHLSEDVIFLVFHNLNWNPKLIATLSCVCKWFDDLAKRVLWKEFCRTRAPKMLHDLQSNGSHIVDGNWRALGKLLIYCSGCTKGGLFNSVQIPGHFVYQTRFSRTSGKSFLLPQCRTDVLYVSDPCEHLDQGKVVEYAASQNDPSKC